MFRRIAASSVLLSASLAAGSVILWDNAQPLSAGGPTNGLDSSAGPVGIGHVGLVTHQQTLPTGGTRFISARSVGENVNGITLNSFATTNSQPSGVRAPQAIADDFTVPAGVPGWKLSSAKIHVYAANGDGGLIQGAYAALFAESPLGSPLEAGLLAGGLAPADTTTGNRWLQSTPANFYRTTSPTDTATSREMYTVELDLSDFPELAPGVTYYIAFAVAFFQGADPDVPSPNSNFLATPQLSPAIDNGTGRALRFGSTAGFSTWGLADGNLPFQPDNPRPAEFSFQLYGVVVPEPAAATVLLAGGLLLLGRVRRCATAR